MSIVHYVAIYFFVGLMFALYDWANMEEDGREEHLNRFGLVPTLIQYAVSVPIWPAYLFTRRLGNEPARRKEYIGRRRLEPTQPKIGDKQFNLREPRDAEAFFAYMARRRKLANNPSSNRRNRT